MSSRLRVTFYHPQEVEIFTVTVYERATPDSMYEPVTKRASRLTVMLDAETVNLYEPGVVLAGGLADSGDLEIAGARRLIHDNVVFGTVGPVLGGIYEVEIPVLPTAYRPTRR